MITVQPSTSFEAVAQFDTGLTGTLGVRITDNAGATTLARTTAGITEYPAGSGIYAVTLTSPGAGGGGGGAGNLASGVGNAGGTGGKGGDGRCIVLTYF